MSYDGYRDAGMPGMPLPFGQASPGQEPTFRANYPPDPGDQQDPGGWASPGDPQEPTFRVNYPSYPSDQQDPDGWAGPGDSQEPAFRVNYPSYPSDQQEDSWAGPGPSGEWGPMGGQQMSGQWPPQHGNSPEFRSGRPSAGPSGEWPGLVNGQWPPHDGGGEFQPGRPPNHAGRPKRRFCTTFPDVSLCRRGQACAFAHSREEVCAPLLEPEEEQQEPHALTDAFFMYKYKTRWCPVGVQHEWHTCVYAHNYQDARRPVGIGYGAKLCPYWSKRDTGAEYRQRCPLGLRCPYAHGAKEQLYHPHYFKTVVCRDLRGRACPREGLCAFFHHRTERRPSPPDDVDYSQPLKNEALPQEWVVEFLAPPFLPEARTANVEGPASAAEGNHNRSDGSVVPYTAQAPHQQGPYGQQTPSFFYMPVGAMMVPAVGLDASSGMQSSSPMNFHADMSPSGMHQVSPNWVFMPMEGGGAPM